MDEVFSDCDSYRDILQFNPRVNLAVEFFFTRSNKRLTGLFLFGGG